MREREQDAFWRHNLIPDCLFLHHSYYGEVFIFQFTADVCSPLEPDYG